MILHQHKYLALIGQCVRYNCSEQNAEISGTRFTKSLECNKKSIKTKGKTKKMSNIEITSVNVSHSVPDNIDSSKSNLKRKNMDVANARISDGTITNQDFKCEADTLNNQNCQKSSHVRMSDFILRNMMSFPLVASEDLSSMAKTDEDINFYTSSIPSVSTILNDTVSKVNKQILEQWKQKMILDLGEEKFNAQQADPVRNFKDKKLLLKNKRKSKKILVANLTRGTKFHSVLKKFLKGNQLDMTEIDKEVEGCWESVKSILPVISDVKLVEGNLCHPVLHYKGIVDCVASYRNTPSVIEWKQSEKEKKDISKTYDAPVQLCAYMGALSWSKKLDPSTKITNGLIVVAYTNGSPANVFPLDSEMSSWYWQEWLRRLQQFWMTRCDKFNN